MFEEADTGNVEGSHLVDKTFVNNLPKNVKVLLLNLQHSSITKQSTS